MEWRRQLMSFGERHYLFMAGQRTRYFIDRDKYDQGYSKYKLYGSGMDPSGCAAQLDFDNYIRPLKARAEARAQMEALIAV